MAPSSGESSFPGCFGAISLQPPEDWGDQVPAWVHPAIVVDWCWIPLKMFPWLLRIFHWLHFMFHWVTLKCSPLQRSHILSIYFSPLLHLSALLLQIHSDADSACFPAASTSCFRVAPVMPMIRSALNSDWLTNPRHPTSTGRHQTLQPPYLHSSTRSWYFAFLRSNASSIDPPRALWALQELPAL